jgi:hypothetical protein
MHLCCNALRKLGAALIVGRGFLSGDSLGRFPNRLKQFKLLS